MKLLKIMLFLSVLAIVAPVCTMDSLEERDKKQSEDHAKATQDLLQKIRDRKLTDAVCSDDFAQAELWLKAGANPNAEFSPFPELKGPLLYEAMFKEDPAMIELLLFYKANARGEMLMLADGEEIEVEPLHASVAMREVAKKGASLACTQLLGSHADIRKAPITGQTALHFNGAGKHPDVAAYLLSCGAQADINMHDRLGLTPLHYTCTFNAHPDRRRGGIYYQIPNPNQVKYLLCCGANSELSNERGETALYLIREAYLDIAPDTSEDERKRRISAYAEIETLLTDGPSEKDYEETSRDFIEISPLEPSARGNVFKQLTHRQHGIAKS